MPKSRKTRKTKSVVEDVDEEVEAPPERTIDSDVNDDGDFSDFSL